MSKQETRLSLTNHATHLCKCNGVADLLKHTPPHVLPCQIWSFCIKECKYNTEPPKLGVLELRCLGMGGVAEPKVHAPPPRVLPRQIW